MRSLTKGLLPPVLRENGASWLKEWLADKHNETKRYRYRHPDIKAALIEETSGKCVYCESLLGIVHPGETEHKIPSSKMDTLHFEWTNLTRACTECNRRKNDFYRAGDAFVDPYVDDVETMFEHEGPITLWQEGSAKAEVAVRVLELNQRVQLVLSKTQALLELKNVLSRCLAETDSTLKEVLRLDLVRRALSSSQYSAMVRGIVERKGLL